MLQSLQVDTQCKRGIILIKLKSQCRAVSTASMAGSWTIANGLDHCKWIERTFKEEFGR